MSTSLKSDCRTAGASVLFMGLAAGMSLVLADGPDAAKPAALGSFLASHPITKAFPTAQKPATTSYATPFLPGNLSAGITADDPMITIRGAAHPVSSREHQ